MKIAIIGSRGYPYVYSGYETFVKELSERLSTKDVRVHVYCHKNLFKAYPRVVKGINLHYIPTIETKALSQLVHSFLSFCHAMFCHYDVILVVNAANGPLGIIPRLFGKKTIINVDGLEWLRPKWKGLGAKYFYFAAKISTKLYDLVVTDADEMRNVYLREFNSDSTVIAYGAPASFKTDESILNKWNLVAREFYLIVGRLIPDNNADLIIKSFIKSPSHKTLVVVGDVPYKDKYADDLKQIKSDKVKFLGYVNDSTELMTLYRHCFVYVHGHKFGGTNPTMLKAMACDCAILALDTPFNREMLAQKYGFFFGETSLARLKKT
jgi:glycosyltransferase involved in cell wall biosynthesis